MVFNGARLYRRAVRRLGTALLVLTIGVSAAFVPSASAATYNADEWLDHNSCGFGGAARTEWDGTITYSAYYNCQAASNTVKSAPKNICARLYRTTNLTTPVNLTCRPAAAATDYNAMESGYAVRTTNSVTTSCLGRVL